MLIFEGEGLLNFLRNNLFLVCEEISRPPDIHGFRKEEEVFGFTSTSGKAKSPALLSISKKLSKEDFGLSL